MQRCIQLALLGSGKVAPNPMVGSVLVHNNRIIGEGYHREYGKPHAEVNCLASVKKEDLHLVSNSTLYVSLEPCAHFGKTPPCADMIIEQKIPEVVIGIRDPFYAVDGKGIEKLEAAGIKIELGILEEECRELNKRFFCFNTLNRPYVVLKWAQTMDGIIAAFPDRERLLISNDKTNRLVHRWRSEEMSIMVGTNTARSDNPALSTRLWPGPDPVRLVIDMDLKLPSTLKLFDKKIPTIVFNRKKHTLPFEKISLPDLKKRGIAYFQVSEDSSLVQQVLVALYQLNIQSVLVEGGAYLLQSFIDEGIWDEARIITNQQLLAGEGLPAPSLSRASLKDSIHVFGDLVHTYYNPQMNE
jgi:diaminohydroxyphosphoribosylaminopyrimidine deaminase/5-amino-6-(5-phosphoribosylamino)uracil reductase